jgi:hypothetical protein
MDQYKPSFMTNSKGTPPDKPEQVLQDRQELSGDPKLGTADKYSVSNLMYPVDLMGSNGTEQNQYSGSYVMFYLNVQEDSMLLKQPGNPVISEEVVRSRGFAIGRDYSEREVQFGAAALGGFSGLGGSLLASSSKVVTAGVGAGVGAVAATVVGSQASGFTRPQKRLKAAIALHVPNQLNIRYSANWQEEETEAGAYALEAMSTVTRALEARKGGMSMADIAAQESGAVGAAASAIATKFMPNILQVATGVTSNPRKEQLFRGVDFRTFVFDYSFFPRNEKEAEDVLNIIYMFKLHMHPEFKGEDLGQFLYVYPSEFDISYFYNNQENLNLHRHTSCVLTEMNVQYAPEGQYTTFSNGISTHINVSLTFKELSILTKKDIQKGL